MSDDGYLDGALPYEAGRLAERERILALLQNMTYADRVQIGWPRGISADHVQGILSALAAKIGGEG